MVKISQEFDKSVEIFRKVLKVVTFDVLDKNFSLKKMKYLFILIILGDICGFSSLYSVIRNRDVDGMCKFGFIFGAGLKV
jgi:hypothetical protein